MHSTISRLMASAFEIDVIVSMLKSLPVMSVAFEFQERYNQRTSAIISNLSKGIVSLPDELLPIIFELAVQEEGCMGATQAIRLSHVSRRFRDIALEDRNLWTTMRSNASKEELETFVCRSGTDMNIYMFVDAVPDRDGPYENGDSDALWKLLMPAASRWRTLSLAEHYSNYARSRANVLQYRSCLAQASPWRRHVAFSPTGIVFAGQRC